MALSPNYSWAEPDNSSLVKNGAADIRTLGDAIDTSVWNVGYGQAGKNKIINGDFGFWARGTSFTSPAATAYTADRFCVVQNGTGTSTISQQAFTLGTAPVAGYESTYFLRHLVTAVGTSTVNGIEQRIESVRTFAGQTMTVSFWAKADTARTITMRVDQFFGSGGSPSASVTGTAYTFSATTAWTRFSQTITLPSISGKTLGTNLNDAVYIKIYNANTLNSQMDLWGVQAEYGSKATPFQTATGTIQGELAACRRYLPAIKGQYSTLVGFFGSTTGGVFNVPFDVEARVAPTGITVSNVADWGLVTSSVGTGATTAIAWNYGGVNGATVSTTHTAGTPTTAQNNPGILRCTGASGYILFTGCEL